MVGARPQFIKAAAVSRAIAAHNRSGEGPKIEEFLVHTGQHYDENMSKVFFDELNISPPNVNLEVGSGSHGRQTGLMLEWLEKTLLEQKPHWALIYGDTNSTLAGALAAVKLHVPVAHVEAGLRSFNRRMPEEINRIVADTVSTLLFCPTQTAVENLAAEGISDGVEKVGDVMYDSVLHNTALAEEKSSILETLELKPKSYYLGTVHRQENTDDTRRLKSILTAMQSTPWPVILPLHPRTRKNLADELPRIKKTLRIIDPVPYLDMLILEKNARVILTDSGGVQKEAYWFKVPCVTMRDETEWVELVSAGWNHVVGADFERIVKTLESVEREGLGATLSRTENLYGEGRSCEGIIKHLVLRYAG